MAKVGFDLLRGATLWGPTLQGPTLRGRVFVLQYFHIVTETPMLAKIGQLRMAKVGLAKVGLSRSKSHRASLEPFGHFSDTPPFSHFG